MARGVPIKVLRTTRANLDSQAGSSGLLAGEPYLITDEARLAVGTGTGTYQDFAKLSEAGGALDIHGATDIGTALDDTDEALIYDASASANRKSAVSRIWTYVSGKVAAGIAPLLTGYTIQGMDTTAVAAAYLSGSTLTIPLNGGVFNYTLAGNTTIAFSGAPTAPVCSDTVLILKQAASGGPYAITAWPSSGVQWPYGIIASMPTTASARLSVRISTRSAGEIDIYASQMAAGS